MARLDLLDKWKDEDDEYPPEPSGDREPRDPKKPLKEGGAALPIPEEELCLK